jgi:hypothetical protein
VGDSFEGFMKVWREMNNSDAKIDRSHGSTWFNN